MKKKYVEPVMVVDDFSMNEMVAKCELNVNATFTSQISQVDPNCGKSQQDLIDSGRSTTAYATISDFGEGFGDFDNEDKDNDWLSNYAAAVEPDSGRHCFLPKYQAKGFCTFDASKYTFMDYAQSNPGQPQIPACAPDTGSSLLQNS